MTKKKLTAIIALVLSLLLALSGCSAPDSYSSGASSPPSPGDYGDYDDYYDPYYSYSQGESYLEIEELGFQLVEAKPESTFSLKVDTASYSNIQRFIKNGDLPPKDAVRTEELINWFSYDEPLEFSAGSPFGFYTEIGPSPFDDEKLLAMIRVGTREVDREDLPPCNLVFLIDVSGSMGSYDKLPLLQDSLVMLCGELGPEDTVSIVTYASGTRVALSGASGADTKKIENTINRLSSGGSTAGAGGIQLAYEQAQKYFIEGGNNRVILATDGDFNVGISDLGELSDFISEKRETGVYLSVLGFGTGNIRDDIMETLARDGNGNYSYIDSLRTAEKVLVNELSSNLFTVADDVKAQIVFDPDTVYSYRLIGYENRMLQTEDFDNDRKDAGEIGAGSDVVALFELEPLGEGAAANDHLFDVRVRYKDPGESKSQLIEFPVAMQRLGSENTSDFNFACAVALFGDYLRTYGYSLDDYDLDDVYDHDEKLQFFDNLYRLALYNDGVDEQGYRADFRELITELYYL